MPPESKQTDPPATSATPPQTTRGWIAAVCWGLAALAVTVAACRAVVWRHVEGELFYPDLGFYDFNHGVYFPTQAFLDGVSPYGQKMVDAYPVDTPATPLSPIVFLIHAPLALLPQNVSQAVCFALNTLLLVTIARAAASSVGAPRSTPVVACLLALSRAGHSTLFTGYLTFEVVLGSIVAIEQARRRPWLAAMGLMVASSKINFAVPIGLLMLARGDTRAALRGAALALLANGLAIVWLAGRMGPGVLVEDFLAWQTPVEKTVNMTPLVHWTMIDLGSAVAKWFGSALGAPVKACLMIAVLAPIGVLLRRLRGQATQSAASPSGVLMGLTALVAVHHQFYDLALIAPGLLGLALARPTGAWSAVPAAVRWSVFVLALFPAFNPLSTAAALDLLAVSPGDAAYTVLTSLNSAALAAGLLILALGLWTSAATDSPKETLG